MWSVSIGTIGVLVCRSPAIATCIARSPVRAQQRSIAVSHQSVRGEWPSGEWYEHSAVVTSATTRHRHSPHHVKIATFIGACAPSWFLLGPTATDECRPPPHQHKSLHEAAATPIVVQPSVFAGVGRRYCRHRFLCPTQTGGCRLPRSQHGTFGGNEEGVPGCADWGRCTGQDCHRVVRRGAAQDCGQFRQACRVECLCRHTVLPGYLWQEHSRWCHR